MCMRNISCCPCLNIQTEFISWNKSCQKNCSETIRQDPADVRHQDVTTRVKWTKLDTALQKTSQTTLAVVTRKVETAAKVTTTNTEPLSLLSLWRRGRKESEKNKRKTSLVIFLHFRGRVRRRVCGGGAGANYVTALGDVTR